MPRYIIMGGIGNGSVIASAIKDANSRGEEVEFAGYLNDRKKAGDLIEGDEVLGGLDQAREFLDGNTKLINTILRIDGNRSRVGMIEKLGLSKEDYGTFVHPSSYIPADVRISEGCVIMPHVLISPGVSIGPHSLVMVGASIGHNTTIGDFVHIAAQATIGSHVSIDTGVHIGLNSTIRERTKIEEFSTLGMGSVLTKDIAANEIWVGVPAKLLRTAVQ